MQGIFLGWINSDLQQGVNGASRDIECSIAFKSKNMLVMIKNYLTFTNLPVGAAIFIKLGDFMVSAKNLATQLIR